MKCARMSMKKQWSNIGKHASRKGLALEAALTGNESINALIRAGYEKEERRKSQERSAALKAKHFQRGGIVG